MRKLICLALLLFAASGLSAQATPVIQGYTTACQPGCLKCRECGAQICLISWGKKA